MKTSFFKPGVKPPTQPDVTRAEIMAQVEKLTDLVSRQTEVIQFLTRIDDAAREFMDVCHLMGANNIPIFSVVDGEDGMPQLVIHKIISLAHALDGTEPPPPLCLSPNRSIN